MVSSAAGPRRLIVVEDIGKIVLVCRQEEYDEAKKTGREPVTVGFKKVDVIK